jgi:hypothetical protein
MYRHFSDDPMIAACRNDRSRSPPWCMHRPIRARRCLFLSEIACGPKSANNSGPALAAQMHEVCDRLPVPSLTRRWCAAASSTHKTLLSGGTLLALAHGPLQSLSSGATPGLIHSAPALFQGRASDISSSSLIFIKTISESKSDRSRPTPQRAHLPKMQ